MWQVIVKKQVCFYDFLLLINGKIYVRQSYIGGNDICHMDIY